MASIRPRVDAQGNKTFQVQVRLKGHPHQSNTFNNYGDAKKWGRQVESDIQAGVYIRPSRATARTVAELIHEYERTVLSAHSTRGDRGQAAFDYLSPVVHPLCQQVLRIF